MVGIPRTSISHGGALSERSIKDPSNRSRVDEAVVHDWVGFWGQHLLSSGQRRTSSGGCMGKKRRQRGVGPPSSSLFSELVASLSGRQKLEEGLPETAADHLARKREGSSHRSLRSKREHLQFPSAIPFQALTALYVRLSVLRRKTMSLF
ncbi:hypothetical protein GW17_00020543 [Ensete ventricosum]|nr:hypothetical protein GW17_00020543 [Ensete ventricosum]